MWNGYICINHQFVICKTDITIKLISNSPLQNINVPLTGNGNLNQSFSHSLFKKLLSLQRVQETSNTRYKTFNADCSETGKLNYLNQNALIVCIYVYILCMKIWVQTYNCIDSRYASTDYKCF